MSKECMFPEGELPKAGDEDDLTRWCATGPYLKPNYRRTQAMVQLSRGIIDLLQQYTTPAD